MRKKLKKRKRKNFINLLKPHFSDYNKVLFVCCCYNEITDNNKYEKSHHLHRCKGTECHFFGKFWTR